MAVEARRPGLEVVFLVLRESHVARAHCQHPVVQTETLENVLGIARQLLELIQRGLCARHLDELHL